MPNDIGEIHLNSSQVDTFSARDPGSVALRPRLSVLETHVQGNVRSGGPGAAVPLEGALVRLYKTTAGAPRRLGSGTTDATGNFSIESKRTGRASNGVFYATADLGHRVQLVSIIGPTLAPFVTVNELTTVAAGYAMAQFTRHGAIAGPDFGLRIAAGMNDNLVSPTTGESSEVLLASPNGDQTNSLRSTRALANLLALYVRNGGQGIESLFALAKPPGGPTPRSFLQALSNIARNPQQNVAAIFSLTGLAQVYTPSLVLAPDAWTITVKVNDTGDDRFLFGGPGNLVFDANDYAWITNNVVQGTPNSSRFSVVLQPNGKPADGRDGTPRSPLLGGGLLGGGYGVTIDPRGHGWFGNFGWGIRTHWPSPDGNGSVSEFDGSGRPVSGPLGYQGGPVRAQAVVSDRRGNIWIASFGNDRVYVFPHGDPSRSIYFQEASGAGPFDIEIARDGTAWVTNSGGLKPSPSAAGSVAQYALRNHRVIQLRLIDVGHTNKGIALDSRGNAWIASGGDNSVYLVTPAGKVAGPFTGGGSNSPWGITVDGDDNVWVGNFGPTARGDDYRNAGITKLAGVARAHRPPGLRTGDPISPSTGYTLPSAGAEVLLHDGTPLYGPQGPPSFSPLMRMTSVVIDQAGNLWAVNNWKPRIDFDIPPINGNPGGDGICIFVGLAKPPAKAH